MSNQTFPSTALDSELIPSGWKIVEDVEPSQLDGMMIKTVSFLFEGEENIPGEVMLERAEEMKANLGFADAKYLANHQDKISIEFRYNCLVFSGTVFEDLRGCLHLAYLAFGEGNRWHLLFVQIDGVYWTDDFRLLCCKDFS
ncbi:MAG: hypothetical protein G01um101413_597 [Parcubacteria group bacterium Gr01-1014_13]|nr:MAG: hypothetical protein G01um101413_597 [Parcubacteria group bacterium Gr01-1014_13]